MNHIRNREFWDAAIARAVWTLCETFLAAVGTAPVLGEINWGYVLGATGFATALSLAKSIVKGLPEVDA